MHLGYIRSLAAVACAAAVSLSLAACANDGASQTDGSASSAAAQPAPPEMIESSVDFFFPDAERVVVAAADPAAAFAAARFAVAEGLPVVDPQDAASAPQVEAFGSIEWSVPATGEVTEHPVEGPAPQDNPFDNNLEIAQLTPAENPGDNGAKEGAAGYTFFATGATPVAQLATARAAGARVLVLAAPDPRASNEALEAVESGAVVALAEEFGTTDNVVDRASLAGEQELPGGGHLVFPGRRMVALYGHPSGPALGAMGEQDPQAAVARVQELAAQYQELTQVPVIPAFEIIATVASGSPGPDGDYANESDPADLIPYVDAIVDAGGYAVIDLQPGRARLLDQAKIYEDILRRPNVGLAIDPEWKIGPDEVPMTSVGHVEAAEVNEVARWLADLVRENNLPQKAFIIHQFQLQMVRDRETIDASLPELAFTVHVDGHGPLGVKMETWNAIRQGLGPEYFVAWKNFYDEDEPMLDPAGTYAVEPRPWFVSYQ